MPRSARALITTVFVSAAVAVGPVGSSLAEPPAIAAKRAQVAQLMAQLNAIAHQAALATEVYNGARWQLQGLNTRIKTNHRSLARTNKSLAVSQRILARRASEIYRAKNPSVPEIVLTRGSITDALEVTHVQSRVTAQDIKVVNRVATLRKRIVAARTELRRDRAQARVQYRLATQQKVRIEGLLRQRQRVLNAAAADLRRAIAAEQARQRIQAERQRQAAIAAQAAQGGRSSDSGGTNAAPASDVSAPANLPSGSGNAAAAQAALQYLGTPYKWGGAKPGGFDCSGLANYVFAKQGKDVPHYTGAIWNKFPKVDRGQLQSGDLVFFSGGGHMGIYLGEGKFVHAPRTGDVVKVSTLESRAGNYVGAVRP